MHDATKHVFVIGHLLGGDKVSRRGRPIDESVALAEAHVRILSGLEFSSPCYTSGYDCAIDTAYALSRGKEALSITQLRPFPGIDWKNAIITVEGDREEFHEDIRQEAEDALAVVETVGGLLSSGKNVLIVTHPVLADAMYSLAAGAWPNHIGSAEKRVMLFMHDGKKLLEGVDQLV